jgi:HEAT repeat protein
VLLTGLMSVPSLTLGVLNAALLNSAAQSGTSSQQAPATTESLVEQFKTEELFWRQFSIAAKIAERNDPSVLPLLADWLSHDDRHIRGNVAFIFARLGDARGFQTLTAILTDRSDRPQGQGIGLAPGDGVYRLSRQVAADRYYAAHLLGDLRDPWGVPVLVKLLNDPEVNMIVPWALAQIGDKRAVAPLLDVLNQDDATARVLAIFALEALGATEAVPRLVSLFEDHRRSKLGSQVSVSDAAKAAVAKLK